MKHRDETVEMAVLPGNRRDEDPRRTVKYVVGSEAPRTLGGTVRFAVAVGGS